MDWRTEGPLVMKRGMETDDARMTGSEPDESILLRVCGLQLIVADKMALVDNLDRILLTRAVMCSL